jgi:hypothetical protein
MHDFCDETAPSRLMRRADTSPVIAVKVFVELDVVAKMWIALKNFLLSVDRSFTILTSQEKPRQPAPEFSRNLIDR